MGSQEARSCKVDECSLDVVPKRRLCKEHLREYSAEKARVYRSEGYVPPAERERVCRICGAPAIAHELICVEHRNERERNRLQGAGPCGRAECEAPRARGHSYCLDHKREKQRATDTARRRARGTVARQLHPQPEGLASDEKWCYSCDKVKKRGDFHASGRPDELQALCKVCQQKGQKARLETPEGRERHNAYQRENGRRFRYGLGPNLERLLLEDQEFCCAVCRLEFIEKGDKHVYVVDHVRGTTDDIRGLLHNNCNGGLAMVGDHDPLALLGAALYLAAGQAVVPDRAGLQVMLDRLLAQV